MTGMRYEKGMTCEGVLAQYLPGMKADGWLVKLENGQYGYTNDMLSLPKGSRVACYVKRSAEGKKKAYLQIETVLEYAPFIYEKLVEKELDRLEREDRMREAAEREARMREAAEREARMWEIAGSREVPELLAA